MRDFLIGIAIGLVLFAGFYLYLCVRYSINPLTALKPYRPKDSSGVADAWAQYDKRQVKPERECINTWCGNKVRPSEGGKCSSCKDIG